MTIDMVLDEELLVKMGAVLVIHAEESEPA